MAIQSEGMQTIQLEDLSELLDGQRDAMLSEASGELKTAIDLGAVEKAAQTLLDNGRTSVDVPDSAGGSELYRELFLATAAEMDAEGIAYPSLETEGTETLLAQSPNGPTEDAYGTNRGGYSYSDWQEDSGRNDGRPEPVDLLEKRDYEVHLVSYPVMGGYALQKDHLFLVVTDAGGNPLNADEAHLVQRAGPSTNWPSRTDEVVVATLNESRSDLEKKYLTDQDVGMVLEDTSLATIQDALLQAGNAYNDMNIGYDEWPTGSTPEANSNTYAHYAWERVTGAPAPALQDMGDVPGYMHNRGPSSSRDGATEVADARLGESNVQDYATHAEDEYDYSL